MSANGANEAGEAPQDRARLEQLAARFLVHSFLYYRLDTHLIPDAQFDAEAAELLALHQAHPGWPLPHAKLLAPALGSEASGYAIKVYPPEIITQAFRLLYAEQGGGMDFEEFVTRRGFQVRWED